MTTSTKTEAGGSRPKALQLGDFVARFHGADRTGAFIAVGVASGRGDDLNLSREEALALGRFLVHWSERCATVDEWVGDDDAATIRADLVAEGWLEG